MREKGFTLVELMVSAAIFSVIILFAMSLMVEQYRPLGRNEAYANIVSEIQNLKTAMDRDINIASFQGGVFDQRDDNGNFFFQAISHVNNNVFWVIKPVESTEIRLNSLLGTVFIDEDGLSARYGDDLLIANTAPGDFDTAYTLCDYLEFGAVDNFDAGLDMPFADSSLDPNGFVPTISVRTGLQRLVLQRLEIEEPTTGVTLSDFADLNEIPFNFYPFNNSWDLNMNNSYFNMGNHPDIINQGTTLQVFTGPDTEQLYTDYVKMYQDQNALGYDAGNENYASKGPVAYKINVIRYRIGNPYVTRIRGLSGGNSGVFFDDAVAQVAGGQVTVVDVDRFDYSMGTERRVASAVPISTISFREQSMDGRNFVSLVADISSVKAAVGGGTSSSTLSTGMKSFVTPRRVFGKFSMPKQVAELTRATGVENQTYIAPAATGSGAGGESVIFIQEGQSAAHTVPLSQLQMAESYNYLNSIDLLFLVDLSLNNDSTNKKLDYVKSGITSFLSNLAQKQFDWNAAVIPFKGSSVDIDGSHFYLENHNTLLMNFCNTACPSGDDNSKCLNQKTPKTWCVNEFDLGYYTDRITNMTRDLSIITDTGRNAYGDENQNGHYQLLYSTIKYNFEGWRPPVENRVVVLFSDQYPTECMDQYGSYSFDACKASPMYHMIREELATWYNPEMYLSTDAETPGTADDILDLNCRSSLGSGSGNCPNDENRGFLFFHAGFDSNGGCLDASSSPCKSAYDELANTNNTAYQYKATSGTYYNKQVANHNVMPWLGPITSSAISQTFNNLLESLLDVRGDTTKFNISHLLVYNATRLGKIVNCLEAPEDGSDECSVVGGMFDGLKEGGYSPKTAYYTIEKLWTNAYRTGIQWAKEYSPDELLVMTSSPAPFIYQDIGRLLANRANVLKAQFLELKNEAVITESERLALADVLGEWQQAENQETKIEMTWIVTGCTDEHYSRTTGMCSITSGSRYGAEREMHGSDANCRYKSESGTEYTSLYTTSLPQRVKCWKEYYTKPELGGTHLYKEHKVIFELDSPPCEKAGKYKCGSAEWIYKCTKSESGTLSWIREGQCIGSNVCVLAEDEKNADCQYKSP